MIKYIKGDVIMLLYELIGFLGYGFLAYSLLSNKKKNILKYRIFANSSLGIHYLLMGGLTGFATNIVTVFRNIVYSNKKKKSFSNIIWVPLFIITYILLGIVTWHGWISVLPIIAVSILTLSLWQDNVRIIKLSYLIEGACWFIYAIYISSWSVAISVVILSIFLLIKELKSLKCQ